MEKDKRRESMKKISIVIPYYKTYDLTTKLLDVLIKQLNSEVETFLVDDGCNETRLDKYEKDINIIHLEKNGGATRAMNLAIGKAKGEYIAIIDSDDLITKDYIETLLETIKEHDEDVIYFDWQDINTGEIVHHPCNYAPWKAIYKKSMMPPFRDGWRYSYDVPFQEDLSNIEHSEYYIDKILYLYNSNRNGSLTVQKEVIRRKSMIKCEVIENFTLQDFNKLIELKRGTNKSKDGCLYVGDTFKCEREMAEYLTGKNAHEKTVVKILEIEPAKEESKEIIEEKQLSTKVSSKKKKAKK